MQSADRMTLKELWVGWRVIDRLIPNRDGYDRAHHMWSLFKQWWDQRLWVSKIQNLSEW